MSKVIKRKFGLSNATTFLNAVTTGPVLIRTALGISVACISGVSQSALAEADSGALDEIIVTAQKRPQNLQDVPISVSVISSEQLERQNIYSFDDLATYVPNLQITGANAYNQIYIRGLGSGINTGFEQTVGLYIDGIYFGRQRHYRGAFVDIERVEVLKGPQSILFGKNTIAGAINVSSNIPTDVFEMYTSVSYGSYSEIEFKTAISGPLSEKVLGRIALHHLGRDPYLDNSAGDDAVDLTHDSIKGALTFLPSDSLQIIARLEIGDYEEDGSLAQLTDTGSIAAFETSVKAADPAAEFEFDDDSSSAGFDQSYLGTEKKLASITVDYEFGEHRLTAITGAYQFTYDDGFDIDFSPIDLFFHYTEEEHTQFSQEIRLASREDQTVSYIGGIYYQRNNLDSFQDIQANIPGLDAFAVNPIRDYEQDTTVASVFGSLTWNVTDQWHLSFGLRFVYEEKEADFDVDINNGKTGELLSQGFLDVVNGFTEVGNIDKELYRPDDDVLPSFSVQYDVNDDWMTYFSISKGLKSGGYNAEDVTGQANADSGRLEFDKEKALAMEVGLKGLWLDKRLRFNSALFHTKYDDLQVSGQDGLVLRIDNAAEATTQGIELDTQWMVSDEWMISFAYSYLDAEFDKYPSAPATAAQSAAGNTDNPLDGKSLPFAPEHQASMILSYDATIWAGMQLSASLVANYSGELFAQNDLDPKDKIDSYTKINTRLGLTSAENEWEVALIAKNITDEQETGYASDVPALLGVVDDAHVKITGVPRTVLLELNYYLQ